MYRMLIAVTLVVSACAQSTPAPATPTRGHMAAANAPNPRRVTHPENDVTCQDEVPTGTAIGRRKCRSNVEREQDRRFYQDAVLTPSGRPGCDAANQPGGVCPVDTGVTQRTRPGR